MKPHSQARGTIRIGTSGWMYKDWSEAFYPKDLKSGHLQFLAGEFPTVEVNSSFYHLPRKSTFQKWRDETSDEFCFAVKLSRYITHQKKLRGVRQPLERFIKHAAPMGEKLGVVLVQLPPSLRYEEKRFKKFMEDVHVVRARNYPFRVALEPRHKSWMAAEHSADITQVLQQENCALVFAHSAAIASYPPAAQFLTADFVYVRFHGPSEFAASRYGAARLRPWAERIITWSRQGRPVFVYFNNDIHGHAIFDARTLVRQVARRLE